MPIDPSTAFVSYAREDLEFVLRLAKDLKAKGAKVWMDKLDILPGQPWDDKVEIAVEHCARMIVVLSPTSVTSAKVKNEFMDALDLGKVVIPVLFRECKIPQQLKRLQYADFRQDYDAGLIELLASQTALNEAAESAIADQPRLEEERKKVAAAEQARLEQEERERTAAQEKARQEELERQRLATEQARLEKERQQAAEKARLEQERERLEQLRLEEERTKAEEQAHQEEQRKAAAEQSRLLEERKRQEQLEAERKQAVEQARLEQERKQAAERARKEQERKPAVQSKTTSPPQKIMAETVLDDVKRGSTWSIVLGILMILAGILAIAAPVFAYLLIVYVVAWSAIFNGVAQIVYGFRAHSGGRVVLEIILGLLYIVAGIYILMHPMGGLLALTLVIAGFLLIYGVFALVLAFQMRPISGWGWVLFDAIVTILLGVMIWAHWPLNSQWVIGSLLGISFIASGVSRLMVSLSVRKLATRAA